MCQASPNGGDHLENKTRSRCFKNAEVTDQKSSLTMNRKVRKIRVLIRQVIYLGNATEISRHTGTILAW